MNEFISNYIRKQLYEIPIILNRQLSNNNKIFNKRDDFNKIKQRINLFINDESDERFFVLPGLRGVGKTTLLLQAYEYLLKEKDINSIDLLYISCEVINSAGEVNLKEVIETYLKEIHNTTPALLDKKVFLFIDETHYDKSWALNAKIIFDESPNIFMIFTGSSSLHLNYNADAARRLKIQTIPPLNYTQHIKLKYNYHTNISEDICDIIFKGECEKAQEKEKQLQRDLINLEGYTPDEWNMYFKYGGFPSTFRKKFTQDITSELWSIISRVINQDMTKVYNLNNTAQDNAYRLLVFIASQKPGDVSQAKIAANLNTSTSTVNNIFSILEKTQLVFHLESYGGSAKRAKKSWKYYIATSSIKHSINERFGNSILHESDYEGILLENLVGSLLFNLMQNENFEKFYTFYDPRDGGVDFLVKKCFDKPVPIEVGIGKKTRRQVRSAIDKYDSSYGIVVSNKTNYIEKEDDIIYIPPHIFSFV